MKSSRIASFILSFVFALPNIVLAKIEDRNILYESVTDPFVYIPATFAILLSLTDYDDRITRHAGKHQTVYGSSRNAQRHGDLIAFYLLPAYAAASTTMLANQNHSERSKWIQYPSFLYAAAASYFVNDFVKDRTGRLRPDGSNLESFPSSHTAIASAFSGHINHNNLYLIENHKLRTAMTIFNESLTIAVGLARLEGKKHHLTDILVGYAVGKFFSHLFHRHIFNDQVRFNINIVDKENLSAGLTWYF